MLSAYCKPALRKLFCFNLREKKICKKYALMIRLTKKPWEISHVGFLEYLLNKSHQRPRVHRALVLLNVNVPKTPWKQINNKRYISCHFSSNCMIDITVALVNELRISLEQNFLQHVCALHSFLRASSSIPYAPVTALHPLLKGFIEAPSRSWVETARPGQWEQKLRANLNW